MVAPKRKETDKVTSTLASTFCLQPTNHFLEEERTKAEHSEVGVAGLGIKENQRGGTYM